MSQVTDYLPNLPGYRRPTIPRPNTSKKQTFQAVDGMRFVKEELPPVQSLIEEENSTTLFVGSRASTARPGTSKIFTQEPSITLTYHAYFEEEALHTRLEERRMRRCTIYFYVDDGAIMIVERPQQNSGLPQGTILKRNVALKPDGSPYTADDFRVGGDVEIYSRIYHLQDCDRATRAYTNDDTPPQEFPTDPFEESRKVLQSSRTGWGAYHSKKNSLKTFVEAKLGNTVNNKGREGFLKYGNAKLKFLCVWDDTASLYGDVMEYTLIYHLSDDTIEIHASPANNSGREQFPRLLRRSKLPKTFTKVRSALDEDTPPDSVENSKEFYHWSDFFIGCEVFVYARNLVIVDADASTRDFYLSQNLELGPSERVESYKPAKISRQVPPHNGFGSEEDSLQSCVGPLSNTSPPKKKMGENKILSFVADLTTGNPEDNERRFVITYFVTDSTIKVHEIPARNSGFVGGVFLSRGRFKGPDNEWITERSLYVGARVILQSHKFNIIQTNENTLRWMELHDNALPRANLATVLDKLKCTDVFWEGLQSGAVLRSFASLDRAGSGQATIDNLRAVLKPYGVLGDGDNLLCEHELLTIVRLVGNRGQSFDYRKFVEDLLDPSKDDL